VWKQVLPFPQTHLVLKGEKQSASQNQQSGDRQAVPSLLQKSSALSGFVCENELLIKQKARSLLEAMLQLKQPKREGGKYPKPSEKAHGVTGRNRSSTGDPHGAASSAPERGLLGRRNGMRAHVVFNQPTHLHCSWEVDRGF